MTAGALPKGYEKGQRTTQSKKGGVDRTGLAIVIGMISIAVVIGGLGATGVIPMFEDEIFQGIKEQTTSAPIMQEKPNMPSYQMQSSVTTGSYAPSAGDFYGYLEFQISHGDVKSMIANDQTDTLIITIYTYDNGELVIDLDPQGNATTGFGMSNNDGTTTIYDVLNGKSNFGMNSGVNSQE